MIKDFLAHLRTNLSPSSAAKMEEAIATTPTFNRKTRRAVEQYEARQRRANFRAVRRQIVAIKESAKAERTRQNREADQAARDLLAPPDPISWSKTALKEADKALKASEDLTE